MNTNNIDKDFIFKTIAIKLGEEIGLNNSQMNKVIETLTSSFEDINLITSKNYLTTSTSSNNVIIKNFIGCKKMAGMSDGTIEQYSLSVRKLLEFLNKDLIHITTNDIRKYLMHYKKTASNTTVDNRRRCLNSLFQFMEDEGYIVKNPCKKIAKIKEENRYKKFYSDMEIESIKDSCKTKLEVALIDILCCMGLRVSEVTNIKLSDINWENRTMLIHGKGSKDRIVPFTVRCKKHLQEFILERGIGLSEYLFYNHRKPSKKLSTSTIQKYVKVVGNRVSLPNITVHCFRRWLASNLNNKGMDAILIQEILGHTSFSTTKKHYLDKSISKLYNAYNLMVS